MSFAANELSLEGGQPIRLFQFQRGVLSYLYNTSDRDIVLGPAIYRGNAGIGDNGMQFTGQPTADTYTITMPSDSEISLMFRGLPPSDPISVTVRDYHYGDTDVSVAWVGVIKGCQWPNDQSVEIACQSLAGSLEVPGLRLGWQRACPYTLYKAGCKVNPTAYRVTGEVTSLDGNSIVVNTAGSYPAGWFTGGIVEWEIPGGVFEARGIRSHVAGTLTLLGGTYGLATGKDVRMYPGCNRTFATCFAKFNNDPNFGGIPGLPGRSPFDGNPVF